MERPLLSWPGHTSCDLELLESTFPKLALKLHSSGRVVLEKKDPDVIYPVVHVSVTQWMCDFEILNEPKCVHGVVKI